MRLLVLAITALFTLLPVSARADSITQEQLRAHINILASDAFEGRKPGTAGENKTVNYIATEWLKAGLSGGAADSGWYMKVDLVERTPLAQDVAFFGFYRGRNRNVDIGAGQIVLRGFGTDSKLSNVQLVHAGFATANEDQLRSLVQGKVAFLFLSGQPLVPDFPSYRERKARLIAAGARGVIAVVQGKNRWERSGRRFQRPATSLDAEGYHADIEGRISEAGLERLLRRAGMNPEEIADAAKQKGFVVQPLAASANLSVKTQVRTYVSHNVIGKIAGRRPDGDALLYMGHWDHLGICRASDQTDRICNGAVDNASGISLLIESARRLADAGLDRDIYFLATTAEESGLLGARAFVADPVVPLERLIAVFNADSVALTGQGKKIAVIGMGQSGLDPQIDKVAEQEGRDIDMSGKADAYLARQDGYVFTERGVPAFMITSAFADEERLQAFINGRYHNVTDESDEQLLLGGAADDANFHVALGRHFGNIDTYPKKPTSGDVQN